MPKRSSPEPQMPPTPKPSAMAMEVVILGKRNLQNELLCNVLEREIGAATMIAEQLDSSLADMDGHKRLLLVDAVHQPPHNLMAELRNAKREALSLVAFFNLRHGLGIEHEAIRQGIKGFFYEQESMLLLLKGVKLIFQGEVWLPRSVLVEAVMAGRQPAGAQNKAGLSQREVEILAMVSFGASNKAISAKLFISENTVKTHLYNIFKKIAVPNRLQAALWVANNLELR